MQPIHYSLIYNTLALIVTGLVAWLFKEPLLLVVTLLVAQHTMERFRSEKGEDDTGPDEPQTMGFLQDIDSR